MATKKISELEAINAAEDNDVLVIVDTSESTTNKITKGNLLIGAGHTIEMTLNENYQIVLILKNAAGTALSTQTIDLPNENAVTNLAYNNGVLTITKQSGATSQINLTGLIEGLVTESDFNTFKETLQTTLEAINEKDAEQDEAIAENYKVINKLNEKLENQQKVIDQLPQVEGQGTEVTLENTIEATFTKFDVEGNSEQETTTGKNKVDVTSGTINIPSTLTLTQNADGTLTLNGNTGGTLYYAIQNMKFANIVNGNSYKLVTKVKSGTWNAGVIGMRFSDSNAQQIQSLQNSSSSQESKVINGDVNEVRLYLSGTFSATNLVIEIMLVEASVTDDSFEKFTYGASPNPNYEQPIKSAGDNENLFDKDNEEQFLQNLTPDNSGLIVSAQTSTTSPNYIRIIIIPCKSDANYVITRFLGGKTFFIYESDEYPTLNKQTTLLKRNNDAGKVSEIIKTSATAKYLLVKIYNTFASEYYSYDELISSIKIEQGNKATPYSPYGMGSINEKIQTRNLFNKNEITENYRLISDGTLYADNSYVTSDFIKILSNTKYVFNSFSGSECICEYDKNKNNIGRTIMGSGSSVTTTSNTAYVRISILKSKLDVFQFERGSTSTPYVPHEEQDYSIFVQQPMRSIRDVRDCFVKKSDGWYERHYIAEGIFNPYNCGLNGGGTTRLRISMWGYQNLKETSVKSKYFPSINGRWDDNNEIKNAIYGWNSDGVIGVNIDKEIASTLDEFKTWASNVGLNFYYIRKNPTDLPCTPEQIEQLENKPSTYKDFTIIQSEDETPAYLEVSGIRDINTMFDKVTNAIVSLGGNV